MDVDISNWHPIGWKQDFFGRPLQESVTGEIVTIDELMARYNFLLGAAQHGVQPTAPAAQQNAQRICAQCGADDWRDAIIPDSVEICKRCGASR